MRNPLPGNSGDLLTPLLLEGLFGVCPIYSKGREFLAVGSIVKQARAHTAVWGSGLTSPDIAVAKGPKFLAVRGPLTRRALLNQGHEVPEIYGDPAILLPLLYWRTDIATEWKSGFIPHFTHQTVAENVPKDIKVIDILRSGKAGVLAMVDEILRCERIFSSSLHGLILALAYKKPAAWVHVPERALKGDRFKFEDFFASLGLNGVRPIVVRGRADLAALGTGEATYMEIPERLGANLIVAFETHYGLRSPVASRLAGPVARSGARA